MTGRSFLCLCLCLCLMMAVLPACAEKDTANAPVFEDGMAQPVFSCTNLRDADYTNEGSEILRFCVYVETDYDTDADGKADLVEALVQSKGNRRFRQTSPAGQLLSFST